MRATRAVTHKPTAALVAGALAVTSGPVVLVERPGGGLYTTMGVQLADGLFHWHEQPSSGTGYIGTGWVIDGEFYADGVDGRTTVLEMWPLDEDCVSVTAGVSQS